MITKKLNEDLPISRIVIFLFPFIFNHTIMFANEFSSSRNICNIQSVEYKLTRYLVQTEIPCHVHIMFQVTDLANAGISNLTTENFDLLEDGKGISPTESAMRIRKMDQIPYILKTVVMLDNSMSVGANLAQIKNAAINLITQKLPQQQIAIYEFSDHPILVQDFTNESSLLISAVNSMQLGFATTDLYGSIITGVSRLQDSYSTSNIQQGFLIILTDGSDTQGSHTLNQALSTRGSKQVFTIGIGNEIEPSILTQIGNAGSFSIANYSGLSAKFMEIQNKMILYANSFYWLNYMSPKRGNYNHTLKLTIKDNKYNSSIEGSFNSAEFYSVRQGVFINVSSQYHEGIDNITLFQGMPIKLTAFSYFGSRPPEYEWITSDPNIIKISPNHTKQDTVRIFATGWIGQKGTIVVRDVANGFVKTISITIQGMAFKSLIAFYPFNGNAKDESGNGYNGFVSKPTLTNDRFGIQNTAYYFGGSDFMVLGNVDVVDMLNNVSQFSISLWIKPSPGQTSYGLYNIISKGNINENGYGIAIFGDSHEIGFWVSKGWDYQYAAYDYSDDISIANKWIHLVCINNGEKLQLYINGIVKSEINPDITYDHTGYYVTLGAESFSLNSVPYYDHYHNYRFNGVIDDIFIYNKALSQSQIDSLFKQKSSEVRLLRDGEVKDYILSQNYPNPFNQSTKINFYLPKICYTKISILNQQGKLIKTLFNGNKNAGWHQLIWSGKDNPNEAVASGVYFIKMISEGYQETRKMILLR